MPAPRPTEKSASLLAVAFICLVVIQTGSVLLFKGAQTKDSRYTFNPAAQMALAEMTKLVIALALLHRQDITAAQSRVAKVGSRDDAKAGGGAYQRTAFVFGVFPRISRKALLGYSVLAAGYAVNNQLTYHILTTANPGLLTLAKSCTPVLIAVISALFFNERLSRVQWQCVFLQVCGTVSLFYVHAAGGSGSSSSGSSVNGAGRSSGSRGGGGGEEEAVGLPSAEPSAAVAAIALACVLTAACSSLNAFLLHQGNFGNLHAQNCVLYGLGACVNVVLFWTTRATAFTSPSGEPLGFFSGYAQSPASLLLLLSNALVGLCVTVVYRFGNAVVKTLAMSVSGAFLLLFPLLADPHGTDHRHHGSSGAFSAPPAAAASSLTATSHERGAYSGLESGDSTGGGGRDESRRRSLEACTVQTVCGCVVVLLAALMYLENPPQPSSPSATPRPSSCSPPRGGKGIK